jgi:hypothetical protein
MSCTSSLSDSLRGMASVMSGKSKPFGIVVASNWSAVGAESYTSTQFRTLPPLQPVRDSITMVRVKFHWRLLDEEF